MIMSRIREKEAEITDYQSHTNNESFLQSLMSQRRPRRAMDHVSARPSAERQKISPSGISLRPPNVSSHIRMELSEEPSAEDRIAK